MLIYGFAGRHDVGSLSKAGRHHSHGHAHGSQASSIRSQSSFRNANGSGRVSGYASAT